ncbi:MAG: hypothetical protein AB8H80_05485 [Planctomycetota bacterium]
MSIHHPTALSRAAAGLSIGTALWLAACQPYPDPTPVITPLVPDFAEPDEDPAEPNLPPPGAKVGARRRVALPNGLTTYVEVAPNGRSAQIQLGVFAGSLFGAPGLADLSARVLIESSNPSAGQPSLRTRIARLGGTVSSHIGLTSTWFEIRLPAGQLQRGLEELRGALDSTTQSRNQIERMRNELVAERTQRILRDPLGSMTRALMNAEAGTGDWLNGLLDLDPSEVSLFLSRLYRPERCYLAIRAPRRLQEVANAATAKGPRKIANWRPAPPVPGDTGPMDRKFESGLYWAEDAAMGDRARVAIVMRLPDPTVQTAAEWLLMHSCLTLGGTGGRLERLQDEAGLTDITWDTRIEQSPDVLILEMSAVVPVDQVQELWRIYLSARNSLADVAPSPSELRLAQRRALLNARLPELDEGARLRLQANLFMRGTSPELLEARIRKTAEPDTWDPRKAAAAFLESPAWMVAVGAAPPASLQGVRRYELLPPGFSPPSQSQPTAEALKNARPWLIRARAAVGGEPWLARLNGFEATTSVTADQAPVSTSTLAWRQDGTLIRRRTVLGTEILTEIEGDRWFEHLGELKKRITRQEVERLRRTMRRHPLMLLAAYTSGELKFRPIARRTLGDREYMVLEAVDSIFERLRIHIDTSSHLIRTVESWELLDDVSPVHIRESWADYRQTGALRVPHRLRTVWNDGQRESETTFENWSGVLRDGTAK